jgi:hypothetical protein
MKRRDFLAAGAVASSALALRRLHAQPATNRGAVVIGVDRAGNLTPLKAARSGAKTVASWLRAEGFDVKLFVDDTAPVIVGNVFAAIENFVQAGTLDQLVVYFAGHGFISGTLSEFWMLSGAPQNPNEAVSLTESCRYAEEAGIPNVVFISDACRSRADTLGLQRLQGGVLFPGTTNPRKPGDVDQFLAARIGTSAYEVAPANDPSAAQGIFTGCFLEAFKNPYPEMVQTVAGRPVVPNRRLKTYLGTEVPKKAQALSIAYDQMPDSKVLSDEPTYIAHVTGTGRAAQPPNTVSINDVARADILKSGGVVTGPAPGNDANAAAFASLRASSGFDEAKNMIVQARGLTVALHARSGYTISGLDGQTATAQGGTNVRNSPSQGAPSALVEVDLTAKPAASVALRFSNGSGTVLAALRDYVGNVVVRPSGVSDVSYVPSKESPFRSAYEYEAVHVEQLRASVATAAQFGVFRFDGPRAERTRAAAAMADRIRVLKGIDPTLGLYAAYAYDDASLGDKVRSVQDFMNQTLMIDLCDVAMLSGRLSGKSTDDWRHIVPFCPMLSQGWGLLRVKNVQLPSIIAAARDHLRVSLWNSLAPAGMNIVEEALRSGVVK